jgi:hypothetical protein
MKVKLLKKLRKEANAEFVIAVCGLHYEIWCKGQNCIIDSRLYRIEDLDDVMKNLRSLRRHYMKNLVEERKLIRELKRKYKDENWRYSRTQKQG